MRTNYSYFSVATNQVESSQKKGQTFTIKGENQNERKLCKSAKYRREGMAKNKNPDLLIDKEPDTELYFSFDRRIHDVEELKTMFELIGYEVKTHGCEEKGYQDHFFLEPITLIK